MSRRGKFGAGLLLLGCFVILAWGPDHGVNGATILGVLLGIAGLCAASRDLG